MTYGCIRFIDSYRFLSTTLGSFSKTFVDNEHKTITYLEKETFDDDFILNIVNEVETLLSEDRTI